MKQSIGESRGSAVQWFAVAAVVLSAASMAGAHAWLTRDGHLAVVAVRATPEPTHPAVIGIDTTPTGSIQKKTSGAQMH